MSDRSSVFPFTDAADWWQIIRKELKGRPEETLFTEWWEGFQTPPFHSAEEPRAVDPLFGAYTWHASRAVGPDDLPTSALKVLNTGADGLRIPFRPNADLTRSLERDPTRISPHRTSARGIIGALDRKLEEHPCISRQKEPEYRSWF